MFDTSEIHYCKNLYIQKRRKSSRIQGAGANKGSKGQKTTQSKKEWFGTFV